MAKARAIVKRRKAVQNIRKITRTMQLIATARYQQAYHRAMATKPYTRKITELAGQLSAAARQVEHPLLKVNSESRRAALLVLTSNRGLCGGYNAGVLRGAVDESRALGERGLACELHVSGKKGIAYFRFLRRDLAARYTHFGDKPRFEDVDRLADQFIEAYTSKGLDRVGVAYMRFVSTGLQRPTVMQLLPLQRPGAAEGAEQAPEEAVSPEGEVQYDFSPPPDELLAELLPLTLKVRLFQCFTDAAVSEQVARMVAMKAATDAATDMIKTLTTRYNRARQTQITLELLDIMGGSEALK